MYKRDKERGEGCTGDMPCPAIICCDCLSECVVRTAATNDMNIIFTQGVLWIVFNPSKTDKNNVTVLLS
jgi:hypothetical protein